MFIEQRIDQFEKELNAVRKGLLEQNTALKALMGPGAGPALTRDDVRKMLLELCDKLRADLAGDSPAPQQVKPSVDPAGTPPDENVARQVQIPIRMVPRHEPDWVFFEESTSVPLNQKRAEEAWLIVQDGNWTKYVSSGLDDRLPRIRDWMVELTSTEALGDRRFYIKGLPTEDMKALSRFLGDLRDRKAEFERETAAKAPIDTGTRDDEDKGGEEPAPAAAPPQDFLAAYNADLAMLCGPKADVQVPKEFRALLIKLLDGKPKNLKILAADLGDRTPGVVRLQAINMRKSILRDAGLDLVEKGDQLQLRRAS